MDHALTTGQMGGSKGYFIRGKVSRARFRLAHALLSLRRRHGDNPKPRSFSRF